MKKESLPNVTWKANSKLGLESSLFDSGLHLAEVSVIAMRHFTLRHIKWPCPKATHENPLEVMVAGALKAFYTWWWSE